MHFGSQTNDSLALKPAFSSTILAQFYGLVQASFGRLGGVSPAPYHSLNTAYATHDAEDNITRNRELICESLDIPFDSLFPPNLTAGKETEVMVVDKVALETLNRTPRRLRPEVHGVVTQTPGINFFMSTADCAVVTLYDPRHHALGMVHGGFQALDAHTLDKTVKLMSRQFGTRPMELVASFSPSLRTCCNIKPEGLVLQRKSPNWQGFIGNLGDGKLSVNFRGALVRQLIDMGIASIDDSAPCNGCKLDEYFSNSCEINPTGRHATVAGLR